MTNAMYLTLPLLSPEQVSECQRIAAKAEFVDGRISNPHNVAKKNLQLNDPSNYERSAQLLQQALVQSHSFRDFTVATAVAPPLLTKYRPGMKYGIHTDNAFIQAPNAMLRSDISCTIFLNDPNSYEGGQLRVWLGDAQIEFKLPAGHAVLYPSNTLHEVVEVTGGERLVAITFIQSRLADPFQRHMLYELSEVAALEGLNMSHENFTRLQFVKQSLLRYWSS